MLSELAPLAVGRSWVTGATLVVRVIPAPMKVTNDIARRAWEHRQGNASAFTSRYRLTRLVYMERHDEILTVIQRETRLKHWPRQWKLNLIEAQNPLWENLFDQLNN
jgi:putative endonuclease